VSVLGDVLRWLGGEVAHAQGRARDREVLATLLRLEYVQSALYREAGELPGLSAEARALAARLRDDEVQHVDGLRATSTSIGARPEDRPRVAFGDELRTESDFLKLANTLEDAAVSLYNGVAPQLQSPDLRAIAASIGQVEARHAALVRLARDKPPAPLAFDKTSSILDVRRRLRPFVID
jgi:rubrerythrin